MCKNITERFNQLHRRLLWAFHKFTNHESVTGQQYKNDNFFATRIRSMTRRYCFHRCLCHIHPIIIDLQCRTPYTLDSEPAVTCNGAEWSIGNCTCDLLLQGKNSIHLHGSTVALLFSYMVFGHFSKTIHCTLSLNTDLKNSGKNYIRKVKKLCFYHNLKLRYSSGNLGLIQCQIW